MAVCQQNESTGFQQALFYVQSEPNNVESHQLLPGATCSVVQPKVIQVQSFAQQPELRGTVSHRPRLIKGRKRDNSSTESQLRLKGKRGKNHRFAHKDVPP